MGVVMGLVSRKIRRHARKLGVSYSFLFMHANSASLEALAYVQQGRANGKVVITLD